MKERKKERREGGEKRKRKKERGRKGGRKEKVEEKEKGRGEEEREKKEKVGAQSEAAREIRHFFCSCLTKIKKSCTYEVSQKEKNKYHMLTHIYGN